VGWPGRRLLIKRRIDVIRASRAHTRASQLGLPGVGRQVCGGACMHTRTHAGVGTSMHARTHARMLARTLTHASTRALACMHARSRMHAHARTLTHACMLARTLTHACKHTHAWVRACTHAHSRMHAHARTLTHARMHARAHARRRAHAGIHTHACTPPPPQGLDEVEGHVHGQGAARAGEG